MRLTLLTLLTITSLVVSVVLATESILPSTNIFNPNWLVQRRSRNLGLQYYAPHYAQPATYSMPHHLPYQPSPLPLPPPGRTYQLPPSYQPRTAFLVHPAYSQLPPMHLAPVDFAARTYYQAAPVYTQYLAPAPANTFAKRFDSPRTEEIITSDHHSQHTNPSSKTSSSSSPCAVHHLATVPSEHYPVYVLPPKNFQPIIYHQQAPLNGYITSPVPVVYQTTTDNKVKSPEELWYEAEGEKVKIPKNEENEIDSSRDRKKIVFVPVHDTTATGYEQFPVYEAAVIRDTKTPLEQSKSRPVETTNPYNTKGGSRGSSETNTKDGRRYKTKLPVGLTSFFLGGVRGVSGRHWNMPYNIIRDLEFMPNSSPMSPENKYLPEETYVKQVDTSDQSVPAIPGDPEKEGADQTTKTKTEPANQTNRVIFDQNTIIDSALDLEAQESSPVVAQIVSAVPETKKIVDQSVSATGKKTARSRLLA